MNIRHDGLIYMIMNHGFFKGLLFMIIPFLIYRFKKNLFMLYLMLIIGSLSIAGFLYTPGYFGKLLIKNLLVDEDVLKIFFESTVFFSTLLLGRFVYAVYKKMNSYNYLSLKSVPLYFILLAGLGFGYYNFNYSMLVISLYNIILFLMAILTFFILLKIVPERRAKGLYFLQNLLNNLKLLYISFLNIEFGYKLPQSNRNFLKNFVISIENGFVKIWGVIVLMLLLIIIVLGYL